MGSLRSPSILSLIAVVTRAGFGIVILPLVLKNYHSGDINIWFLFASIMTIQNALDVGFLPTMARYFAYAKGGNKSGIIPIQEENEENLIFLLYFTIKKVYNYLSLIIFFLLSTLGTILLYEPLKNSESTQSNFYAWIVLLLVSSFYLRGNKYGSLLLGTNKVAELKFVEIISSIASLTTSIVILSFRLPIAILLINNQIWILFNILLNRMLCKKYYNFLWEANAYQFNSTLFRSILSKSWKSGVGVFFSTGIFQFSGLLYANIGKADYVSIYLFSIRILTLISQIAQAPYYSKIPLMNAYFSKGELVKLLKLSKERISLSMWIFFIIALVLQYFGEFLFTLIGSNISFPPKFYWSVFILAFAFERLGAMHIQLYTVTNNIIWHISNGIAGVLFILSSLVFNNLYGIIAFPMAYLFSNALFFTPFNIYYSSKAFNINIFKFERYASLPILLLLILNIIIND
jgi:hypothetical protein